jgi:nucleoside-diphosphate-sugar epimerase
MRVLIIGGTGMTGPFITQRLLNAGHRVTLAHRTQADSHLLRGADQIRADKSDLTQLVRPLSGTPLDVVVHMVAYTEADARRFVEAFAGVAARSVVISSIDVYRAYGRLHGTEPGTPDPVPLAEDAPLRELPSIHGNAYDKVAVERVCRESDDRLPCTVLRYPAVYGPGDRLRRLYPYVKRMADGRPAILLESRQARWRFSHGYVENVAAAAAAAITWAEAAGRTYNVAEPMTPTRVDWVKWIGEAAGWEERVIEAPSERLPPHLVEKENFEQDWVVDTARIRRELGFEEPVPQAEAMRRAVQWELRSPPPEIRPEEFDYDAEDAALANLT